MSGWVAGTATVVLAWVVAINVGRVRRLDRLHRRLDATRIALAAALQARWDAAERVASAVESTGAALPTHRAGGNPEPRSAERGGPLRTAVAAARSAGPDREPAENALGRALAAVDRSRLPDELRAELAETELRLALARRVHNDAVRDTLALRSRRLVRWLRLAGTAPIPAYFEIADPPGVAGPAPATFRETPADPPR